jgi:two-component system, OmpR family, phosphate regulon response regulator PhoB
MHTMGGLLKVLVVEDEPVIRELVKSLLSEFDCQVSLAATGAEGLKLARTQEFDLILLDVVLPIFDGVTVCRMIKADALNEHVPVYMLTAKTKKSDIDEALKAGANGYILKPFKGAELLDLIESLRKK